MTRNKNFERITVSIGRIYLAPATPITATIEVLGWLIAELPGSISNYEILLLLILAARVIQELAFGRFY